MTRPDNPLRPIGEIAAGLGLSDDDLEPFGRYTAKIALERLPAPGVPPRGKLILVTAITPTIHGEGKTVVSIGLAQGLAKIGQSALVTLREPSLGPVFGVKGGATGGGRSEVLPREKINLHFNGDKHAVAAAHNLLAAMVDAHLFHGNDLRLNPDRVCWPRTLDMNDRALREIRIGLGGKTNGVPRTSGFVITAASEIMAILALAASRADCLARLNEITVGYSLSGEPVRARDLEAAGAMMVLLNEAIMPNLVQTTEHVPALIHAGPFGNIAHGTASVIAQRMGLALADYVINETGFGADLGAEKFLDIVMPASGLKPSAAVVVATVRGVRHQGGAAGNDSADLEGGLGNLGRHVAICRRFKLPTVVALNRFPDDREDDLCVLGDFCRGLGVESAVVDVFSGGGDGAVDLARKIMAAAETGDPSRLAPLYPPELALEEKIAVVAREIYGAGGVEFSAAGKEALERLADLGFAKLPVCMAKTQYSLSDDPRRRGAPGNWTLRVTDARLASGAGFVVVIAGNMMLMPGLPKRPQAVRMTVSETGSIEGVT